MNIIAAAISQDGVVYQGRRHHEVIRVIKAATGNKVTGQQGFLTSDGKFVNREEGARIALAAGQVERLKYHAKELFSEDLW